MGCERDASGTHRACADLVWLAHALTISRIPLAVVFWAVAPHPAWALAVLAIAAATDLVDGIVARAAGGSTEVGAWLDPLCDKTFAIVVLAALAVRLDTPLYLLALIATRELVLVPAALVYRLTPLHRRMRYDFHAIAAGKHATIAQFVAVAVIVVGSPAAPVLAVIAALFGARAAYRYLERAWRTLAAEHGASWTREEPRRSS